MHHVGAVYRHRREQSPESHNKQSPAGWQIPLDDHSIRQMVSQPLPRARKASDEEGKEIHNLAINESK